MPFVLRKILVAVGALVALLLLASVGVAWWYDHTVREKADAPLRAHAARAARMADTFREEEALLRAAPFFQQERPAEDAGPFLNPRLRWESDASTASAPLRIPDEVHAQLAGLGKDWPSRGAGLDRSRLDLGWMAQLARYGRWDLLAGGPLASRSDFSAVDLPVPNFTDLVDWAKLRLLDGLAKGAPAAAGAEVRHLAWLCHSTELLLGEVIAASILRADRAAALAARGRGLDPGPALGEEELERMDRVVWGAFALWNLGTPAEVLARAFPSREAVGRCAAVHETLMALSQLRGLESDALFAPRVAALEALLADPSEPCRLGPARKVRSLPPAKGSLDTFDQAVAGPDDGIVKRALARWTKARVGRILVAVGLPSESIYLRFEDPKAAGR